MTEVDNSPKWYTIDGAVAAYGLSKNRVNELLKAEVLAVKYEGAKRYITAKSLDLYMDSLSSTAPASLSRPHLNRKS